MEKAGARIVEIRGEDRNHLRLLDVQTWLGNNGYDKSTLMGLLKKNNGSSSYTVPAGINSDDFNEVWVWCEKFNVGLGVAKF